MDENQRANLVAQRRRGLRKQPAVTPKQRNGVTIGTVEMCALAGRLNVGDVTPAELQLAIRLLLMLVRRLPADAALDVGSEQPR